jgi:hypothetical protein
LGNGPFWLDFTWRNALTTSPVSEMAIFPNRKICNQQVVGSNPTAGSLKFRLESLAVASHPLQAIVDFRLG